MVCVFPFLVCPVLQSRNRHNAYEEFPCHHDSDRQIFEEVMGFLSSNVQIPNEMRKLIRKQHTKFEPLEIIFGFAVKSIRVE